MSLPITLKFWRPSFAKQVFEWYESYNYPVFFRHIAGLPTQSDFENYPGLANIHVQGIFHAIGGLIGLVTFYDWDLVSRTCSVGILVDEAWQGQDIASHALMNGIDWVMQRHGIEKVTIEFSSKDEKIIGFSWKYALLLKGDQTLKIGNIEKNPIYEGKRKKQAFIKGEFHDFIYLGVFKNDFLNVKGAFYGRKS